MSGLDDEERPERRRASKAPTAFRTISEVADELHIPQHVLRFWETKFPQLAPLKRGGGRRYYRPEDIALLRRISDLLYIQGYTIKGVQRLLHDGTLEEAKAGGSDGEASEGVRSQLLLPGLPSAEVDAVSASAKPVMRVRAEAVRSPSQTIPASEAFASDLKHGQAADLHTAVLGALKELRVIRMLLADVIVRCRGRACD